MPKTWYSPLHPYFLLFQLYRWAVYMRRSTVDDANEKGNKQSGGILHPLYIFGPPKGGA